MSNGQQLTQRLGSSEVDIIPEENKSSKAFRLHCTDTKPMRARCYEINVPDPTKPQMIVIDNPPTKVESVAGTVGVESKDQAPSNQISFLFLPQKNTIYPGRLLGNTVKQTPSSHIYSKLNPKSQVNHDHRFKQRFPGRSRSLVNMSPLKCSDNRNMALNTSGISNQGGSVFKDFKAYTPGEAHLYGSPITQKCGNVFPPPQNLASNVSLNKHTPRKHATLPQLMPVLQNSKLATIKVLSPNTCHHSETVGKSSPFQPIHLQHSPFENQEDSKIKKRNTTNSSLYGRECGASDSLHVFEPQQINSQIKGKMYGSLAVSKGSYQLEGSFVSSPLKESHLNRAAPCIIEDKSFVKVYQKDDMRTRPICSVGDSSHISSEEYAAGRANISENKGDSGGIMYKENVNKKVLATKQRAAPIIIIDKTQPSPPRIDNKHNLCNKGIEPADSSKSPKTIHTNKKSENCTNKDPNMNKSVKPFSYCKYKNAKEKKRRRSSTGQTSNAQKKKKTNVRNSPVDGSKASTVLSNVKTVNKTSQVSCFEVKQINRDSPLQLKFCKIRGKNKNHLQDNDLKPKDNEYDSQKMSHSQTTKRSVEIEPSSDNINILKPEKSAVIQSSISAPSRNHSPDKSSDINKAKCLEESSAKHKSSEEKVGDISRTHYLSPSTQIDIKLPSQKLPSSTYIVIDSDDSTIEESLSKLPDKVAPCKTQYSILQDCDADDESEVAVRNEYTTCDKSKRIEGKGRVKKNPKQASRRYRSYTNLKEKNKISNESLSQSRKPKKKGKKGFDARNASTATKCSLASAKKDLATESCKAIHHVNSKAVNSSNADEEYLWMAGPCTRALKQKFQDILHGKETSSASTNISKMPDSKPKSDPSTSPSSQDSGASNHSWSEDNTVVRRVCVKKTNKSRAVKCIDTKATEPAVSKYYEDSSDSSKCQSEVHLKPNEEHSESTIEYEPKPIGVDDSADDKTSPKENETSTKENDVNNTYNQVTNKTKELGNTNTIGPTNESKSCNEASNKKAKKMKDINEEQRVSFSGLKVVYSVDRNMPTTEPVISKLTKPLVDKKRYLFDYRDKRDKVPEHLHALKNTKWVRRNDTNDDLTQESSTIDDTGKLPGQKTSSCADLFVKNLLEEVFSEANDDDKHPRPKDDIQKSGDDEQDFSKRKVTILSHKAKETDRTSVKVEPKSRRSQNDKKRTKRKEKKHRLSLPLEQPHDKQEYTKDSFVKEHAKNNTKTSNLIKNKVEPIHRRLSFPLMAKNTRSCDDVKVEKHCEKDHLPSWLKKDKVSNESKSRFDCQEKKTHSKSSSSSEKSFNNKLNAKTLKSKTCHVYESKRNPDKSITKHGSLSNERRHSQSRSKDPTSYSRKYDSKSPAKGLFPSSEKGRQDHNVQRRMVWSTRNQKNEKTDSYGKTSKGTSSTRDTFNEYKEKYKQQTAANNFKETNTFNGEARKFDKVSCDQESSSRNKKKHVETPNHSRGKCPTDAHVKDDIHQSKTHSDKSADSGGRNLCEYKGSANRKTANKNIDRKNDKWGHKNKCTHESQLTTPVAEHVTWARPVIITEQKNRRDENHHIVENTERQRDSGAEYSTDSCRVVKTNQETPETKTDNTGGLLQVLSATLEKASVQIYKSEQFQHLANKEEIEKILIDIFERNGQIDETVKKIKNLQDEISKASGTAQAMTNSKPIANKTCTVKPFRTGDACYQVDGNSKTFGDPRNAQKLQAQDTSSLPRNIPDSNASSFDTRTLGDCKAASAVSPVDDQRAKEVKKHLDYSDQKCSVLSANDSGRLHFLSGQVVRYVTCKGVRYTTIHDVTPLFTMFRTEVPLVESLLLRKYAEMTCPMGVSRKQVEILNSLQMTELGPVSTNDVLVRFDEILIHFQEIYEDVQSMYEGK